MAIKRFTLFHISMVPLSEPSFETLRDYSREDWLRKSLSRHFEFPYHANEILYWVPQEAHDGLIVGVIEKARKRLQHLPPNQGGAEISKEEWQGAYVLIDPSHHDDGQKMAVENDIVGQPMALVKYLSKFLNDQKERPYELEPRAIFDSSDYQNFLEENGPILDYAKFHFVVPNMWNTAGKLDKELRETGEETGTEELDITFKSRRGIRGNSQRIIEGVDYAARGAGSVRAKSSNGKRFSSDSKPTQTEVEISDTVGVVEQPENWISKQWRRILGRE